MSNTSPKKTAAQLAWRRLRDRDVAAALSDRKSRIAQGVIAKPHEQRTERVLSISAKPDSVRDA